MSFDPFDALNYVLIVVSIGILAFGAARAYQIARAFVNRTYRARAYWGCLLMAAIGLGTANNFVMYPTTSLGSVLTFFPFAIIVVLLLAFVDRGVYVAEDGDFFHREIWRWHTLRKVAYAATVGTFLALLPSYYNYYVPDVANSPLVQIGADQVAVVVPLVFAYSVGALVIGGRRTSDLTMKRHIRMLGYGFFAFIMAFPFFIAVSSGPLEVVPNALIIFANWFLYRAVMSLSNVGKIDRSLATDSGPSAAPGPLSTLISTSMRPGDA